MWLFEKKESPEVQLLRANLKVAEAELFSYKARVIRNFCFQEVKDIAERMYERKMRGEKLDGGPFGSDTLLIKHGEWLKRDAEKLRRQAIRQRATAQRDLTAALAAQK